MSRLQAARVAVRQRVDRALDHPIVRKELLESFRSRKFMLVLSGMLVVAALTILLTMYVFAETNDPHEVGRKTFKAFVGIELILVLLVFPSFSCTAIVEERTNKSLDLLLTTRLTPGSVLVGKLIGVLIYAVTFIVATMPLAALTFLWGGVEPEQILVAYLGQALLGLVAASYGMLISCLAETPARAVVRTFLLMPFVGVIVLWPAISMGLSYLEERPDWFPVLEFASAEGLNAVLLVGGAVGWIAAWVVLLMRLAINRVQPTRQNRTTPLRLWLLGVWAAGVGLIFAWVLNNNAAYGYGEARAFISDGFVFALVVLAVCLVAFAVDEPQVSARSRELPAWLRRSVLAGLLAPGARRGVWFVTLLFVVGWALVGLVFSNHMLDDPGLSRSLFSVWAWGGVIGALLSLLVGQAALLLRPIGSPLRVRVALLAVLLIAHLPMLWFWGQSSAASGALYKGYWLCPTTVARSVLGEPPLDDRRLRVFAPSGAEVNRRLDAFRKRLLEQGVSRWELNARVESDSAGLRVELREAGVPVHALGAGIYLALWLILLGVERRRRARSSAEPGQPPQPEIDSAV